MRLILIVALAFLGPAAEARNGTADHLLQTVMTSPVGGIAQLGGRVEIACHVLRPADVVMVKLLKLSLSPDAAGSDGGDGQEVFTAGGGRQKLRSPWDGRPDLTFNGSGLAVRFNMSQTDEGRFRCDAVTLDGQLPGNALQLLTLQRPSAPGLLFDGRAAEFGDRLETVIGDNLTVNCSANVGKPAGDIRLTFAPEAQGSAEQDIPGATNASWTGPIVSGNRTVSTIFKSALVTVRVEERHHGGCFVCRLTPSSLAAEGNDTAPAANSSSLFDGTKMVARSPTVWALFAVRNIRMEPFRENFFHGDYLECLADGRPAPDILWSRIQGVEHLTVNGSLLGMPQGAPPGYYSYTCSATNTVRGRSHQLLQSIGFNLHNRTAADSQSPDGGSGGSVTGRVKTWVTHHQHGLAIGLACVGVLAGLALVGALIVCFCSGGGYSRLSGAKSQHHSVRDRMRYYGELGDTVIESSDEEDEDGYHLGGSRQLLGGGKQPGGGAGGGTENGGGEWNGTQV